MMRPVACQTNAGRIQVLATSRTFSRRTTGTSFGGGEAAATTPSWKMWLGGIGMIAAFGVTVLAAGLSVSVSYDLDQVQQRRQVALQQQKVLQQDLAQAQSLETVQAYAQENGFETAVEYQASLTVQNPVAQR